MTTTRPRSFALRPWQLRPFSATLVSALLISDRAQPVAAQRNNFIQYSAEDQAYLDYYNYNVGRHLWFGIIGIVFIASAAHWLQWLQGMWRRREAGFRTKTKRLPRVKSEVTKERHASIRFFWYWLAAMWRKYSIKHSHIAEFFFLGNLGQLALIAVYLLLNGLLMGLGTLNDIDWVAHHSARLVYANLPLVIGLAGKNNVLSLLTGFAYESLNVLHRWSARFIIVQSVIHIAGRIHVNVPSVDPGPGRRYIAWGWAAFALFLYMIFMASRPIRNAAYQTFLIQHIFVWFIIVPSLVIHRPQEQGWIWAGLALHLLDRIGRGLRIAYYHVLKTAEEIEGRPTGSVKILSDDTIRVTVVTRQDWIPGQHVYLHCPDISPGGHPFTVSNISRPLTQTDNKRPFQANQELIIRVREGLTRRIYNVASKPARSDSTLSRRSATDSERTLPATSDEGKEGTPIRAWSEGSYGHETYFGEDFNTLMLVAGGSGVSYSLSLALDLVRRARAMHHGSEDKSVSIATTRLSFVWMVKKPEQVEWIGDHLRDMCTHAPPGFLHVTIFITGKRTQGEPAVLPGFVTSDRRPPIEGEQHSNLGDAEKTTSPKGGDENEDRALLPTHGSQVILRGGRPDFNELVEAEVAATEHEGWFAIGSCGPTPMNDSLSDAVSKSVKPTQVLRGEVRRAIQLQIEEFGW